MKIDINNVYSFVRGSNVCVVVSIFMKFRSLHDGFSIFSKFCKKILLQHHHLHFSTSVNNVGPLPHFVLRNKIL